MREKRRTPDVEVILGNKCFRIRTVGGHDKAFVQTDTGLVRIGLPSKRRGTFTTLLPLCDTITKAAARIGRSFKNLCRTNEQPEKA